MILPFPAQRRHVLDRIASHPVAGAPEEMRTAFARLVLGASRGARSVLRDARMEGDADDSDARALSVTAGDGPRAIWLHGGGYVFGAPETHLRAAAWFARAIGGRVLLPRYRLAPEHRWPAALEDARRIWDGEDATVLVGDSAGGHLALSLALRLASEGRAPRALVLFSPNADRSGAARGRSAASAHDPMVKDEDDRRLAAMAGLGAGDPDGSPALSDLSKLPPTLVEVGAPEVLLGDATLLVERAAIAGAEATLRVTPGLVHMGQLWAPWWPAATESLDRAAAFVRDAHRIVRTA